MTLEKIGGNGKGSRANMRPIDSMEEVLGIAIGFKSLP